MSNGSVHGIVRSQLHENEYGLFAEASSLEIPPGYWPTYLDVEEQRYRISSLDKYGATYRSEVDEEKIEVFND